MTTYPSMPRETVEFIPIIVTVDGSTVTTAVKVCITADGAPLPRPTVWTDPVTIGDQIGVMTVPGQPGIFHVWAQVTDVPEVPVIYCGYYRLT